MRHSSAEKGTKMPDAKLQAAVREEIETRSKVDHLEIAVSAEDGVITLRGTVGSPHQKLEAARVARRVRGVRMVKNELDVKPLIGDRRRDAELRGAVLQALASHRTVPAAVDAEANDGVVTLTGTVHQQSEREEAEIVAGSVPGVRTVRSKIVLEPMPSSVDVKNAIEERYRRLASIDAERITVETHSNGTVVLSGFVSSWAERNAAVEAARSLPNVTEVEDLLEFSDD
jgi:osmotically-inducible protein OsmY